MYKQKKEREDNDKRTNKIKKERTKANVQTK